MPVTAIRVPLARVRLGRLDDERLAALAGTGDERAFELLYDRHHRALLGFCRHTLGSHEEGEDALQQTFLRAHGALRSRGAPAEVRPWLYAIARNRCRTMLAARKPATVSQDDVEPATEGLAPGVERRADLRALLGDIGRLPEDQRSALVLAELADLSHAQIGTVIGVPATKVKALVHQARSRLIAERDARDTPCQQVREQLATARGGALRRGPLRRHLSTCEPCRDYKSAVARQRASLGLVLPVLPSAGLKDTIFGAISGGGGGAAAAGGAAAGGVAAGSTALSAGGGTVGLAAKGLGAKLAIGAALAGGAGGGAIAVEDLTTRSDSPGPRAVAVQPPARAVAAGPGGPATAALSGGVDEDERVAADRPAGAERKRENAVRREARAERRDERKRQKRLARSDAKPDQAERKAEKAEPRAAKQRGAPAAKGRAKPRRVKRVPPSQAVRRRPATTKPPAGSGPKPKKQRIDKIEAADPLATATPTPTPPPGSSKGHKAPDAIAP